METNIIMTVEDGVITIHFEGEVNFLAGSELAGDVVNHDIDIVAFSNEFEKLKQ